MNWRQEIGPGYSALLHSKDRLFTMTRENDEEVVLALDARTGELEWRHAAPGPLYEEMDPQFGKGPNATPLILGDRIFAIGIGGRMRCLALDDGELLWSLDLHERYGRAKRKEEYGFSSSPLSYGGSILVVLGGEKHGVVALDPRDGSHVWGSEPTAVSCAPAAVLSLAGRDQLVFFTPREVVGADLRDGRFLWQHPVRCHTENNLTPALALDASHVWVSSQFEGATRVLQVPAQNGELRPTELWLDRRTKQAHWHSFRVGDLVYGSIGGNYDSEFAAVNWRTGETVWTHPDMHAVKGILVGKELVFLEAGGRVGIARPTPEKLELLVLHPILGENAWTVPTLVGTTLYGRNQERVVAIDLAESSYSRPR